MPWRRAPIPARGGTAVVTPRFGLVLETFGEVTATTPRQVARALHSGPRHRGARSRMRALSRGCRIRLRSESLAGDEEEHRRRPARAERCPHSTGFDPIRTPTAVRPSTVGGHGTRRGT